MRELPPLSPERSAISARAEYQKYLLWAIEERTIKTMFERGRLNRSRDSAEWHTMSARADALLWLRDVIEKS